MTDVKPLTVEERADLRKALMWHATVAISGDVRRALDDLERQDRELAELRAWKAEVVRLFRVFDETGPQPGGEDLRALRTEITR